MIGERVFLAELDPLVADARRGLADTDRVLALGPDGREAGLGVVEEQLGGLLRHYGRAV